MPFCRAILIKYSAPGTTARVSTSHSESSLYPLVLNHGPLEHVLLILTTLYYHATQLGQRFAFQLPLPTDQFALGEEEAHPVPKSLSPLLVFVKQQFLEGAGDIGPTNEDVLRLVLAEFEDHFRRGNEVRAIASQFPGTLAKRLDVVISYYRLVLAKWLTGLSGHTNLLFFVPRPKKSAGVYAIFRGQGNIEEYFNMLREMFCAHGGLVENYLGYCAPLLASLSRDHRVGKAYFKGLDVKR